METCEKNGKKEVTLEGNRAPNISEDGETTKMVTLVLDVWQLVGGRFKCRGYIKEDTKKAGNM